MIITCYRIVFTELDTGRYTLECLTEREQVKHVSTLAITESKTTLLCQ